MKIQPHSHRSIEIECGDVTRRIEHFNFHNQNAIHIDFDPRGMQVKPLNSSSPPENMGGHIILTKKKEPR